MNGMAETLTLVQASALESQNQSREGSGVKPAAMMATSYAEKERGQEDLRGLNTDSQFSTFTDSFSISGLRG